MANISFFRLHNVTHFLKTGNRVYDNAMDTFSSVSFSHSTARPSVVALRRTAWSEQGMGMGWHGKCATDTAALCKSNGKDIF